MHRKNVSPLLLATTVSMVIASFAEGYKWTGTVNGIWDLTSLNWMFGGGAASFVAGSDASFDASSATKDVTIGEGLAAGTAVFDGEADYSLSSTHGTQDSWTACGLTGATKVEKRGSGTLTVNNMHGFTGDIDIYGGTYKTGNGTVDKPNGRSSPLGDVRTKRTITVHTGGTLELTKTGTLGAGTSTSDVQADVKVDGGTLKLANGTCTCFYKGGVLVIFR